MWSLQLKASAKRCRDYPFVVSAIVWYNVLFQINKVSKILQRPKVSVETVKKEIKAVTDFLEEFWNDGLESAQTDAREITEKLEMEMSWPEVRQRRNPRHFEYEEKEQTQSTAVDLFKSEFSLPLIDTALVTLKDRFSHMETFYELHGFLFSTDVMRNTEKERRLDECCHRLEQEMMLTQRTSSWRLRVQSDHSPHTSHLHLRCLITYIKEMSASLSDFSSLSLSQWLQVREVFQN